MIHIPLLRCGSPYRSRETVPLRHHPTGEQVAELSQANPGLVTRDFQGIKDARKALAAISTEELLQICRDAGQHFMEGTLSIGVGEDPQSPDDYLNQLSATTGLPLVLCKKNREKIHTVLTEMETVLDGLTRGLKYSVLDNGYDIQDGRPLSYFPTTDCLGVILPSHSPGVDSLWLPAIALKIPLLLKPGREDPWTPLRIAQAFIQAGAPAEAFGFYPAAHSGAAEILRLSGRSMLFGDATTTTAWAFDPRVQVHGPGYSKVILGADLADHWENFLDLMITSILENGGSSCVNASAIWVTKNGREIAEALGERLAMVPPRPAEDPEAQLAAFPQPRIAEQISAHIDQDLRVSGAEEITAKHRIGQRVVRDGECAYLMPTVVYCESASHPLANREFLFPYASVIEAPQSEIPDLIGPTLAVTVLTEDESFIQALLGSSNVQRLNVGAIPTCQVSWDQPHEGNLFEHLYQQRAIQHQSAARAATL